MNKAQLQKVRDALVGGYFTHGALTLIDAELAKPEADPAMPAAEWLTHARNLVYGLRSSVRSDSGVIRTSAISRAAECAEENLLAHLRKRVEPAPIATIGPIAWMWAGADDAGVTMNHAEAKQLHDDHGNLITPLYRLMPTGGQDPTPIKCPCCGAISASTCVENNCHYLESEPEAPNSYRDAISHALSIMHQKEEEFPDADAALTAIIKKLR